jgi:hypothetical protein
LYIGRRRGGNQNAGIICAVVLLKIVRDQKREKTRPGLSEVKSGRFSLFVTENNPGFGQVIGRHFDVDFVAFQDADTKFAHFARGVGKDFVTVLQLDLEHGIGQTLQYRTRKLQQFLFRHIAFALCSNRAALVRRGAETSRSFAGSRQRQVAPSNRSVYRGTPPRL